MPKSTKKNSKENGGKSYDFSGGKRGAVIPQEGKTRITMWVDTDVLDWFRTSADREGRGYQTAMNEALREYATDERRPFPEVVREIVREELRAAGF